MSEFALIKRGKIVGDDNCRDASSRRDGIAYVSKTAQKARARSELVRSQKKQVMEKPVGKSPLLAPDLNASGSGTIPYFGR